jgi:hypothetical protein
VAPDYLSNPMSNKAYTMRYQKKNSRDHEIKNIRTEGIFIFQINKTGIYTFIHIQQKLRRKRLLPISPFA